MQHQIVQDFRRVEVDFLDAPMLKDHVEDPESGPADVQPVGALITYQTHEDGSTATVTLFGTTVDELGETCRGAFLFTESEAPDWLKAIVDEIRDGSKQEGR